MFLESNDIVQNQKMCLELNDSVQKSLSFDLDFQRHLPCLSQVTNESETQCAAQCAHYDTLMSQLNASHVFNRAGGEMFTDLVRQSCE